MTSNLILAAWLQIRLPKHKTAITSLSVIKKTEEKKFCPASPEKEDQTRCRFSDLESEAEV
jgi:hypothetical protein